MPLPTAEARTGPPPLTVQRPTAQQRQRSIIAGFQLLGALLIVGGFLALFAVVALSKSTTERSEMDYRFHLVLVAVLTGVLLVASGAIESMLRRLVSRASRPGTMIGLGVLLAVGGGLIGVFALVQDTTVKSDYFLDGRRFYNLGLMNEQRNCLILSGVATLSGVLFIGFGVLAKNQAKGKPD